MIYTICRFCVSVFKPMGLFSFTGWVILKNRIELIIQVFIKIQTHSVSFFTVFGFQFRFCWVLRFSIQLFLILTSISFGFNNTHSPPPPPLLIYGTLSLLFTFFSINVLNMPSPKSPIDKMVLWSCGSPIIILT